MSLYPVPPEPAIEEIRWSGAGTFPVPRTSFVGRRAELARTAELLARTRLLTLLGPGGGGKTRIAIATLSAQREHFGGRCSFADLGPLEPGARIVDRVAESIGVEEPERGISLEEALSVALGSRPSLLILDGCEHVLNPAARLVATLLAGSPGLCILATSREPLAVEGELTWSVPALSDDDAVALFVERASAVRPDRPLGPEDHKAVADLCRHLDGLPLALELAAARSRALSPREIAVSLGERFALLSNGPRTGPARHSTLRASMDWSYDLLSEPERVLLRRLGTFGGSFDAEAVRAVAPEATIVHLADLVQRSLVVAEVTTVGTSYRLLESVRSYGMELLVAAGEDTEARRKHRDHYLELAERAQPMLSGPDQPEWMERLCAASDNLAVALAWSRDAHDDELLARQAIALTPYWLERSQWTECSTWLRAASTAGPLPPTLQAQVLNGQCYLETWVGNWSVVPQLAGEALTLARTAGDPEQEAWALGYLAVVMALGVGAEAARPFVDDAAALARAHDLSWALPALFTFFSLARLFQADPDEPRALLGEAFDLARLRGDRRWIRLAGAVGALTAVARGRVAEAAATCNDIVEDARRAQHAFALIVGLCADGWVRLLSADADGALAATAECVAVAEASDESRAFHGVALCIRGWTLRALEDLAGARDAFTDAAALIRGSEFPRFVGLPLVGLAEVLVEVDDTDGARASLDEATAVATAAGYPWILGRAERVLARLAARQGDDDAAEAGLHRACALHEAAGDLLGWCDSLDDLAARSLTKGRPDLALRLWAATSGTRRAAGGSRIGAAVAVADAGVADARRTLADDGDHIWTEGSELDLHDATAAAARNRGGRGRPRSGWQSLTPAEREVVRLVGQHLTNPQIADALFVARSTVKTHLVHIFSKLGVSSRSELAALALQRPIGDHEVPSVVR